MRQHMHRLASVVAGNEQAGELIIEGARSWPWHGRSFAQPRSVGTATR